MLNKKYRLNQGFDYVYRNGYKVRGKYGMVIGKEDTKLKNCVFAIVIPKKFGKAIKRNKAKRWVRSIVQGLINEGFFETVKLKVLYVAFEGADDYSSLEKELLNQFEEVVKISKK